MFSFAVYPHAYVDTLPDHCDRYLMDKVTRLMPLNVVTLLIDARLSSICPNVVKFDFEQNFFDFLYTKRLAL